MRGEGERDSVIINVEQDRARAGACIDHCIYKSFKLLRFGAIAIFANWAGIMVPRYCTTPVDSDNYKENYQFLIISISLMLGTCLANCIGEFIRAKGKTEPVVDICKVTTAFFAVGLATEFFVDINNTPCSFVDRLNNNITENALNQSGINYLNP